MKKNWRYAKCYFNIFTNYNKIIQLPHGYPTLKECHMFNEFSTLVFKNSKVFKKRVRTPKSLRTPNQSQS